MQASEDDALNRPLRHDVREPGTPPAANTVAMRITTFKYSRRHRKGSSQVPHQSAFALE